MMSYHDELDDDRLDALLSGVASPVGLRSRLLAVSLDDAELDQRLRDVTIPFGLKYRLRRIAAGPAWDLRRLTAAAALLIVIGGWYAMLLGSVVAVRYRRPPMLASAVESFGPPQQTFVAPEVKFTVASRLTIDDEPRPRENPYLPVLDHLNRLVASGRTRVAVPHTLPTDQLLLAAAGGGATIIQTAVLGAPSPIDDLPDPQLAVFRVPRGVEAALNAQQRRYLLDTGIFPFVSPQEFASSVVPPSFDTSSFELSREYLTSGRLPPPEQVRVEEFLAAAEFGFPRSSAQAARLVLAGGVAPWNPPSPADVPVPLSATRLLQVSVQARDLPAVRRKATYLTVGVDVTTSMSAGSRLTMVRQALKSLVERLGPNDRLTLVALGAKSAVLVEDGGRAELDQLLAAVELLRPQGAGRLADGVLQTLLTAGRRATPANVARRAVIVSDACGEFDPSGIRYVEQFLETDAGRSLRLDVVDVGPDDVETMWAELARRRDGLVVRAATTDRLRAALRQSLTGQDPLVAREATLSVTFHDDAVASYRLLGHEPTALTAGLPRRVEFDLSAAQTGTVLYEVQLRGGAAKEIATVVLKWRDPVDGEAREEVRTVTRGMVGLPPEQSTPALQMAALAAATAGRLRNSPLADNVSSTVLLQWARRLERTRAVRGLEPWLGLLDDLDRLAVRKSAARGLK